METKGQVYNGYCRYSVGRKWILHIVFVATGTIPFALEGNNPGVVKCAGLGLHTGNKINVV